MTVSWALVTQDRRQVDWGEQDAFARHTDLYRAARAASLSSFRAPLDTRLIRVAFRLFRGLVAGEGSVSGALVTIIFRAILLSAAMIITPSFIPIFSLKRGPLCRSRSSSFTSAIGTQIASSRPARWQRKGSGCV